MSSDYEVFEFFYILFLQSARVSPLSFQFEFADDNAHSDSPPFYVTNEVVNDLIRRELFREIIRP
jgi:hypothetical protein